MSDFPVNFVAVFDNETEKFDRKPFLEEATIENVICVLEKWDKYQEKLYLAYHIKEYVSLADKKIEFKGKIFYLLSLWPRESDVHCVLSFDELMKIMEERNQPITINKPYLGECEDSYFSFPNFDDLRGENTDNNESTDGIKNTDENKDKDMVESVDVEKDLLRVAVVKGIMSLASSEKIAGHKAYIENALGNDIALSGKSKSKPRAWSWS
ncbi:hypothetical protein COEREDRAFT_89389 [Coemansia reversa NRRL 1564]|uniref:Uncharacterized protein n=1 Tax=Coemansia reversa (strain ATCC 12441 / NRRL 1564) TaxID=763665 RepID=A0A2G5B4I3_COERN|nr:hypothetical protein COEREDRAFT_89389 [Coemansia reversa NRRL 1564]|eukprot:PIA13637.1 hypothetical protein COEREDRAFT_89389 [Coemansia reversa NRRL 1564]